jgi:hypothetical protein
VVSATLIPDAEAVNVAGIIFRLEPLFSRDALRRLTAEEVQASRSNAAYRG